MPEKKLGYRVDLVLEGGGAKGLGTTGTVIRLLEEEYTFPRIAGTSAGAITAAVVTATENAGGGVETLKKVMGRLEPSKIPDTAAPHIPLLSEGLSLFTSNGLFEGDYIRDFLHRELKDLGVETFGDLRRDEAGDDSGLADEQLYSLVVMATDVTHGRLLRLPWDYKRVFNRDPDQELVADAVRMSLSIPFYFKPCTLTHKDTGEESVIVDGGVLSNFPIEIFDRTDGKSPRWETFGVRLFPDLPAGLGNVLPVQLPDFLRPGPLRLLEEVVATAIVGRDQTHLDRPGVRDRTIRIDTSGVQLTEFDLTKKQLEELIHKGWQAANDFLRKRQRPVQGTDAGQ